jgi:hypothetical protein
MNDQLGESKIDLLFFKSNLDKLILIIKIDHLLTKTQ